jgi:hypothetical protein
MPEGEALRNAIKWISEMRRDAPEKSLRVLIQEAGLKFDLGPKDEDFLANFYAKNED